MKKIYLAVFLACTLGGAAHAQISEGGIPWSMSLQNEAIKSQKVARVELPAPDYDRYRKEDEQDALNGTAKPYRVEARVYCNIDINNSGTWYYLEDGRKIWRVSVEIPEATALDFFYDKFTLPEGVRYFLSNDNRHQLLGAYTQSNNNEFNSFTNEQVEGNVAHLEMNVPAGMDISKINFHIHRIGAGYRGYEDLAKLYGAAKNKLVERPTDASPCHVNANCPEGDGEAWRKAKQSTVRININDAGWCSGSLINSTGNATGGTCKPYLLTASHCDSGNEHNDEGFINWKFNFNYLSTDCEGSSIYPIQTRNGAYFRARSYYPTFPTPDNSLVADFLLLELRDAPLPASDAYLIGWNRATSFADELEDYRFIGFHHPAGDRKKLSRSNYVTHGTFNQTVVSGTHWVTSFSVGGTEGGSSGSGLFDKDGYLIGDLSGGPEGTGACAPMGIVGDYSKFNYAWENTYDQTAFPDFAGSQSRLKDWLDPSGLNPMTLGATKYDCSDMPSDIKDVERELKSNILVYPVPSIDGILTVKSNFTQPRDILINVYDINGALKAAYTKTAVVSQEMVLDLSGFANGTYLISVENDGARASHKVVIAK